MTPAEIAAETDRLWGQVKPLYEQLHCYARTQLTGQVRRRRAHVAGGMLPAHLMGNMWQQDWGNLWDMLQPYQDGGDLDITGALQAQCAAGRRRRAGQARRRASTSKSWSTSTAPPTSPPPSR